jgi:hypothetical protein
MNTLHIEHPISDYATWKAAFDRFAPAREAAGVRGFTVRRPIDDRDYISVDLDFDSAEAAADFEVFLRTRVWASPDSSPALVGTPTTRILDVCAS